MNLTNKIHRIKTTTKSIGHEVNINFILQGALDMESIADTWGQFGHEVGIWIFNPDTNHVSYKILWFNSCGIYVDDISS